MRASVLLETIFSVALVTLAACGKRPVMRPLVLAPECEILPRPAEAADSITIALFDGVEPEHAPWARSAGERILFRYLYETLITVDCLGDVQAGLAESWESGQGGRRWTFILREGARFWDGTAVTARDVARSWRDTAVEPMARDAGIDSVAVSGDRVLQVYFAQPHQRGPRMLSAPAFAVARASVYARWPLGSGPYRVVTWRGFAGRSARTITADPAFGEKEPVIRFLETSTYDARDLIEGVIDVMVTADLSVIEYAAGRPHLTTVALPWSRTYVLLSTSRVRELRWGGAPGTISSDLRDRLARDAVRGDARGYHPPSWWDDLHGCDELSAVVSEFPHFPRGAYSSSGLRRILYDLNDPVARDLAERIVALAATDPAASPEAAAITSAVPGLSGDAPGIIAEGVTRGEMDSSLRDGDDFAYIIAIPRRPVDPCYEARRLINQARWLANLGGDFPEALIPLVDTRLHVIAKRDRVGLILDGYGDILILNGMLRER